MKQQMNTQLTIGQYKVRNKIGQGSFGQIYEVEKDGKMYAIKTESITNVKPMVSIQFDILKKLQQNLNVQHKGYGFPKVYEYHQEEHFSYMSMDKFDLTLQDLANQQLQNQIDTDVILIIMFNTLNCLEAIHQLGYLYRDVKPSNFMLSKRQLQKGNAKIYLIDLGLCKKYLKKDSCQHIAIKTNKKMIGTPIFCSLNTHMGLQNSRRDDLESWVYMTIYLLKRLPWQLYAVQSLPSQLQKEDLKEKQIKYQKIYQTKRQTNIIQLIKQNEKLPRCLTKIFHHIKNLQFQQKPNYKFIYQLIQEQYNKITGHTQDISDIPFRIQTLKKLTEPMVKKDIKINFKILNKNKQLKKVSLQEININQILQK